MQNYLGSCKGICNYNLAYNFFAKAFAITNFNFCGALFKHILSHSYRSGLALVL